MLTLRISNQPSLAGGKTLAASHCCVPLLWLALFSAKQIEEAYQDDDNVVAICSRSEGLQRLELAIPFLVELFPLSTSLTDFAGEFITMLKVKRSEYIVFDSGGWAYPRTLTGAAAIENHRLDASYHMPAKKDVINPFTGELSNRPGLDLKTTCEVLESLCGYQIDHWGEEERGRFIGYPPAS